MPGSPNQRDRRSWWALFGVLALVGLTWAIATPPVTGPDEVEQARRAAAVARGDLIGARQPGVPPLVVDVRVPQTYGEASVDHWRCFLGPLVDGSPQQAMPLPPSTCPDISRSSTLTTVQTVQYRGQPFFYALVGLGTRWPGPVGMYLMRLLSILPVAALLASAAASVRRARPGGVAGLALAAAVTPMVLYLAASTNPSGLETAAALGAWTTGLLLAGRPDATSGRTVARFGVALVVLCLTRGLGPLFAAYVLAAIAVVAGLRRSWELARRRDLQAWGAAVAVAVGLSAAWLAHIQSDYELPPRPGSGWSTALGYLPWYLRQSIGVFGTNDSAVSPAVAATWIGVALVAVVLGLRRAPIRAALLAVVTLVAGLAIQVSAEGLSLPPIGFFWQGRYALPVLLGAVVLAACSVPGRRPAGPTATATAPDVEPSPTMLAQGGPWAGAVVLLVVQVVAFLTVLRHYTAEGPGSLALGDALLHPIWRPPLPPILLLATFAAGVAGALWLLVGPAAGRPVGSGPLDTSPEHPVGSPE